MAEYSWMEDAPLLGEGADGQVRVGAHKRTGTLVAIKRMKERPGLYDQLLEESEIMDDVQGHNNIIKLLGLTTNSEGTFMVFELLDTDLLDLMRSRAITGKETKAVMRQVLEGLAWLHSHGIVHQDVKSSNVLVVNDPLTVKIADFSNARRIQTRPWTNHVGTVAYNAPELLAGAASFGTEIDVWSAGCVFAELLLGRNPFSLDDEKGPSDGLGFGFALADFAKLGIDDDGYEGDRHRTLERIRRWRPEDERQRIKDPKALELLRRLLTVDPSRRITAQEALKLAYFRDDCGEQHDQVRRFLPQMTTRTENFRPIWLETKLPSVAV